MWTIAGKKREYILILWSLLIVISISGCSRTHRKLKLPPVTDGWRQAAAGKTTYIVQPKDTLYSIAWAFGIDYRTLAQKNSISPPYKLRCGQHLYIAPTPQGQRNGSRAEQAQKKSNSYQRSLAQAIEPLKKWRWPALGRIVARFNKKLGGNKGVDIAGQYGEPVMASNWGKVVYSGSGLKSYGKLIIIKHNDDYLSAYAYNSKLLVTEGKVVHGGQKIATMGRDDGGRVRLHFEIRKIGKPVDPLLYLPTRS